MAALLQARQLLLYMQRDVHVYRIIGTCVYCAAVGASVAAPVLSPDVFKPPVPPVDRHLRHVPAVRQLLHTTGQSRHPLAYTRMKKAT